MKKFKVIGNTRYNHNFEIGTIVDYKHTCIDGAICVVGKLKYAGGPEGPQDLDPRDLEEIKEDEK
nr:MAG TPA: hypothetical protein [Caudoviricetes sp.]